MTAAVRPAPPKGGLATWVTLIVGGLVLWSLWAIDASPARLAQLPEQMVRVLGFFWPADWEYGQTRAFPAILESIQIAWIGTMIGAVLSISLAILGARTLFPRISRFIKFISSTIRSVPEILLAIYLVPIVGLGPFAGALAIGIHSVGMLSKLGAEVIESIDMGTFEAVEAAGGSKLQAIRFAVLPQVLPEIVAQWLFRFELNLRASAILGVVGAGGVGGMLLTALRYRQFDKAAAVLLLTILAVLLIDMASSAIRRRLINS
jgi:phosphonate transport system permease protein